jgi:hypothetical protein
MENNKSPGRPGETINPSARPHTVHLTLSYRVLVALVVLLIVPWVLALITVAMYTPLGKGGTDRASGARRTTLAGEPVMGKPGPWGDLEYVPINIAPPTEFVGAANWDFGPTQWHFPNTTLLQLQAFFSEKDMTDAQRAGLLGGVRPMPEINGFVITPSDDLIKGLSAEARGRIYRALALSPLNRIQVNAFRFSGQTFDDWFSGSGVEPAAADLVKSLIYRNGSYMFFADLPLVAPLLKTPEQRSELLKTLAHEHTFLMRLRIGDKSDIDGLVAYWGRGGRAKDIRPLMESLAELPGTHSLPVTYLLPGFARRRIFTYPAVSEEPKAATRDCHWTALNFFNEQPDDNLGNREVAAKVIASDYYIIYNDYQFGDLVLYMTSPGEVIHSAVYIADNVLFTKNGSRPSNPWMLVRLDDMKDFYPSEKPLTVTFFRHKGI